MNGDDCSTSPLYVAGDTMTCPKLAASLAEISKDPFAMYNGSLAQAIVDDIAEYSTYSL